jgi:hypothetical protein
VNIYFIGESIDRYHLVIFSLLGMLNLMTITVKETVFKGLGEGKRATKLHWVRQ